MRRSQPDKKINKILKKEILTMFKKDQRMRTSHDWDHEIDVENTKRMKEIIKEHGWPGKSLVGKKAAHGAWALVQHADHDVEFQKQALKLLREAVEKGEAEKRDLAYLTDRVMVNSGKAQIFGTQFFMNKERSFGPRPIEDKENLDARRKEFRLEPFFEYEKRMQKVNKEFQIKEEAKNKKGSL